MASRFDFRKTRVDATSDNCAWERDLNLRDVCDSWLTAHANFLNQLGISCDEGTKLDVDRRLAEWTIRAFQLTHILLLELGHHHDRMTTRRQLDSCRGEPYAEQYSLRYSRRIWDAFVKEFALP